MREMGSVKRLAALLGLVSILCAVAVAAPATAEAQDDVTITILHNNDGESNLLPDADSGDPGIARFVATLKQLQQDAPGDGVVTLTSGDNFLASKEFSASLANGTPYYDSIALSGLYDAMALGNHDFDFGPDITEDFVSGFDPAIPFLSANADFTGEPSLQALVAEGRIAASTIVETGGTQVGVIGAITPRLPNISSPRGVTISADVAAAINLEVELLGEAGVNKIILISHLQGLAQDQELVPQLEGVDVVIAGGGDELLKNEGDTCLPDEEAASAYPLMIGDTPTVTGPGGYRCIGQLNVTFDADGNVTETSGGAIGVALDGDPDVDVQANVVDPITAALEGLSSNVIATTEIDLDGQRASVRTMSTNEGQLLADAILSAGQTRAADFDVDAPQIAFANGGGIRNDAVITAGDVTEADTFDIAPFGNFVVTGEISRETLKNLMENAVSGIPEAEGRFAQIAGFTATVNLDNPGREIDQAGDCSLIGDEGSRIVDLTLDDGTEIVVDGEVVEGDPINAATVNFLAGGGDCYPLVDDTFTPVGIVYQKALAEYIEGPLGGTISEADYGPETGRITFSDTATDTGDDEDEDEEPDPPAPEPEPEPPAPEPEPEPPAPEPPTTLPQTGLTRAPLVAVGLLSIAMGALALEGRRGLRKTL